MNYSEMSDVEIDAAVAAIIHPGLKVTNFAGEAVVWDEDNNTKVVRYCNSWTDAGPIIEKYKIDIVWFEKDSLWGSFSDPDLGEMQKTPLRAAMIVFLMMQGGDNG